MRFALPDRSTLRRPRAAAVMVSAALALAVTGGTVRAATAGEVTVQADGRTLTVSARSVDDAREALSRAGVPVGSHDVVTPAGPVRKGDTVTLRRAHAYTLTLDGTVSTEWSVRPTLGEALQDKLADRLSGAAIDQVTELPLFPDRISATVTTVKPATVVVSGKSRTVYSNAETVQDLLREASITLAGRDLVLPGPAARVTEGMTVHVSKLAPGQRVVTSPIPFGTVRQPTDDLYLGQTRVAVAGQAGERVTVYEDTRQDGKVVDSRVVSQTVSVPPQSRVILVGTASRPVVQPENSGDSTDHAPAGDTVWDRLAQCESSGNWQINTGNGYYGGLQFDLPTWREYGGTGYPHEHSREEQIAVAERLHAKRGFAPWPVCSRKLGLR